jgi:acyl carrier protein
VFSDALQQSFLANGLNLNLADLEMDSLAQMEFCISLELSTGVSLVPSQLAKLASTDAVEQRIRQALGE